MKAPNPDLCNHLPSVYRDGVYRDDPHSQSADSASASASSRPDGSEYRDEDLPPYQEMPLMVKSHSPPKPQPEVRRRWYQPPPDLPFSTHGHNPTHVQTYFPDYSKDAETLRQMIYEQASYPPTYYVELKGTHQETTYHGGGGTTIGNFTYNANNNTSKRTQSTTTITDFLIRINITHLLSTGPDIGGELHILQDNEKGYRGGIIKRRQPTVSASDIDNQHEELKAWCDKYVADPSNLKSFTLKRKVTNHDTKKLESLLRSAVASTNYRGQVSVDFPVTHQSVIVYSPSRINQWRMTTWICWIFYLTFLWIFSWLYLFLATARYEVVKVIFPYADATPEDAFHGVDRRPIVMSETVWFNLWENSIKRGVIGRMNCQNNDMDDEYRLATDNIVARRDMPSEGYEVGRRYPGGLAGFFGEQDNWGYDC